MIWTKQLAGELFIAVMGIIGFASVIIGFGSIFGWPGALIGGGALLYFAAIFLSKGPTK